MKITFLGTGTSQGVPVIGCKCSVCTSDSSYDKRLRSSVMIQKNSTNIVIDCGPDFRCQMLRENVRTLDAIIFTHEHKDHTGGLDDIRAFNHSMNKAIDVYASSRVIMSLKQEFSYIFSDEKHTGLPQININEIHIGTPFFIKDIFIEPISVMHCKLPVFGYRIGKFTYITDANYISETEKNKIKGSKVLVLNALQKAAHISHFNLEEATNLAIELNPEKTYFTHVGHKLGLHKEISSKLPSGINLAYDGLKIEI